MKILKTPDNTIRVYNLNIREEKKRNGTFIPQLCRKQTHLTMSMKSFIDYGEWSRGELFKLSSK